MTVRAARVLSLLCVTAIAGTLATGVACGVADDWRRGVSTESPTAANTARFQYKGQTRYAPPSVVTLYRVLMAAWAALGAASVVAVVATTIAANRAGATGRRWERGWLNAPR